MMTAKRIRPNTINVFCRYKGLLSPRWTSSSLPSLSNGLSWIARTDQRERRYGSSKSGSHHHRHQQQRHVPPPSGPDSFYKPLTYEDFETIDESQVSANCDDTSYDSSKNMNERNNHTSPIFVPKESPLLHDAVRTCFKQSSASSTIRTEPENPIASNAPPLSDMSLCFFGTGSGAPSKTRNTSSTMLRIDGNLYLFDVGEGLQRSLQYGPPSVGLSHIKHIFITHLHGDHILGLPGLILALQNASLASSATAKDSSTKNNKRNSRKKQRSHTVDKHGHLVVKIYGPPGIYNFLASSIVLSCTVLHSITVHVYELVGGRVRRIHGAPSGNSQYESLKHKDNHGDEVNHIGPYDRSGSSCSSNANESQNTSSGRNRSRRIEFRDPFGGTIPEFENYCGKLYRHQIHAVNGIWTISDLISPEGKKDTIIQHGRNPKFPVRIRAAEVDHLPGVSTFGYAIEEDEPPRNIDAEKALLLNVKPGNKKFDLLKHGFPVLADDGVTQVTPSQVLIHPASRRARKIVIVGDNRGWSTQMTDIAQKPDVLVHEATLTEEDYVRGHSTPTMAGSRALDCESSLLVLNHISPKIDADLPTKVEEAFNGTGRNIPVVPAFDFMDLQIPWMGFRNGQHHQDADGYDHDNSDTGQ